MDVVSRDLNRHLNAIDAQQALEDTIESRLEHIESDFQQRLEQQQPIAISGLGVIHLIDFLKFLTLEEYHPMQGYRWLAVKQLAHDCNDEHARLSAWDIINYASKRCYCRG